MILSAVCSLTSGTAVFAADYWDTVIDDIVIYDPILEFATACPDRSDLFWYDSALSAARREFLSSGTDLDPTLLDQAWAEGCFFLRKGSGGYAARDEAGEIVVYVLNAELGNDEYELDVGWFYLMPRAIRSDVETVRHFD